MKYHYFFIALLLLGCSLNSSQEATLNNAVINYVDAHNGGAVMKFVSVTHPNVVTYYKELGDDEFKDKFELFPQLEGGDFIQDGTIWEIETSNNKIHARYTFLQFEHGSEGLNTSEIEVIAISEDAGLTWFFVDKYDYNNEAIFDNNFRLLDL